MRYLLSYIREWIHVHHRADEQRPPGTERPAQVLHKLSKRYSEAAKELGLRHVPKLFDDNHGIISSSHLRTFAEVVKVITADYVPRDSDMGTVIATTFAWYWACRAKTFTEQDLQDLQANTDEMRAAWEALDTTGWRKGDTGVPKNGILQTRKFHRATLHAVDYVRRFGPMEYLTTETSEALHKPLKTIFRTYVIAMRFFHFQTCFMITPLCRSNKHNASKVISLRLTRMAKFQASARDWAAADDVDDQAEEVAAVAAADGDGADQDNSDVAAEQVEESMVLVESTIGSFATIGDLRQEVLPNGDQYKGMRVTHS